MENNFFLLTEMEEMWAKVFIQVLEDNGIVCVSQPIFGAARSLKGKREHLRIFVPEEHKSLAEDLMAQLFSEND